MTCCVSIAAGGSRVGPPRKAQKREQMLGGPVFGYAGFEVVSSTILASFWRLKCTLNFIVTRFGRSGWPYWLLLEVWENDVIMLSLKDCSMADLRDIRNTPLVPKGTVAD